VKIRDWYVVDMDDGIVRRERTRAACLRWVIDHQAISERVLPGRKKMADGFYEYFIGKTRDDCVQAWIARGDVVQESGFDLDQEPLYPYPDQPGVSRKPECSTT
jgi:hypothetical protein